MKLSDALVVGLREYGVKYVFGVGGANIEHFHDAINRLGGGRLISIMSKCESGAALMADSRSRVHRTLGVCCSTSGGGMVNLLSGIAESYSQSYPVLGIIGLPPADLEGNGAFQDSSSLGRNVDGLALVRSVSKFSAKMTDPHSFWALLSAAIISALSGRPGPSILLIPRNMYEHEVAEMPGNWVESTKARVSCTKDPESNLRGLCQSLLFAKNPLMIIGSGVRKSSAPEAVVDFAKKLSIPTVTTLSSRGDYPNFAENYLGTIGVAGNPSAHKWVNEKSDLIIAVGTGLHIMTRGPIADSLKHKKIFFVNSDANSISSALHENEIIEADPGRVFVAAKKIMQNKCNFAGLTKDYQRTYFKPTRVEKAKIPPSEELLQSDAILAIQKYLPKDGHILFDAGNCAASAMHYTDVPNGSSSTIALGMGGMGYAIPGAIGAQLGSKPGSATVSFVGDGAFLMSGFEVHTAVELGLPILYVIFNNGKHGMCVTRQNLMFEKRIECASYTPVNIAQIARGFGPKEKLWVGRASTLAELTKELKSYFIPKLAIPGVLELVIESEQVPPFTPFLKSDAEIVTHKMLWGQK